MPAPVHARVRIGGSIYNDARWSIGLNVSNSVGSDPFAGGTLDVQGALEDWATNVKNLNSGAILPAQMARALGTQTKIDFVRTARIGADGKESAVALIQLGTAIAGQGDPVHDAQTAIVVSLLTGRPGGSNRGRIYLPAQGVPLADGRASANFTSQLATAAGTWVQSIGDAANNFSGPATQDTSVCIASSKGFLAVVTSVRVGNRLDSQRRRAESQDEVYSSAVVPD